MIWWLHLLSRKLMVCLVDYNIPITMLFFSKSVDEDPKRKRSHVENRERLVYDKRIQRLIKSEYPMLKG